MSGRMKRRQSSRDVQRDSAGDSSSDHWEAADAHPRPAGRLDEFVAPAFVAPAVELNVERGEFGQLGCVIYLCYPFGIPYTFEHETGYVYVCL